VTKAIFVFVSRSDQDPPAPTPLTKDPRSQSSRRRLARHRMWILWHADNDPSGRLRPCRMPRNVTRRRFLGRRTDIDRWGWKRLISTAPDAWRLAPGRSWPDAGRDRMLDMRRRSTRSDGVGRLTWRRPNAGGRTTRSDWMGRLHPGVDREDVGKKPTHAVFSCLELTPQGTPRL
jgi:hypothetical protein